MPRNLGIKPTLARLAGKVKIFVGQAGLDEQKGEPERENGQVGKGETEGENGQVSKGEPT